MRAFSGGIVSLLLTIGSANAQGTGAYPNPLLTHGAIDRTLTPEYICSHSTLERRSVTTVQKKKIFQAYGVPYEDRAGYEVDHFIPLSLGGVNTCIRHDGSEDVTCNLWPQPHQKSFPEIAPWGSETKDKLEYRLYRLMCAGQISLQDAQVAITADWEDGYRQHVAEPPPVAEAAHPFTLPPALTNTFSPLFTTETTPPPAVRVGAMRHRSRIRAVKFQDSGDIVTPPIDFHELWIALPTRSGRVAVHHAQKHRKRRH